MKSKNLLSTLAFIAFFCIAIYFILDILKIGHRPLIEGMDSEKKKSPTLEDIADKLGDDLEKMKNSDDKFLKAFMNWDDEPGYEDYKENLIELVKFHREGAKAMLHMSIQSKILDKKKKGLDLGSKDMKELIDQVLRLDKLVKFLEEDPDMDL